MLDEDMIKVVNNCMPARSVFSAEDLIVCIECLPLILDYFLDGSNQGEISHLQCKSNINIVLCFLCLNELQVYTWV